MECPDCGTILKNAESLRVHLNGKPMKCVREAERRRFLALMAQGAPLPTASSRRQHPPEPVINLSREEDGRDFENLLDSLTGQVNLLYVIKS
jgi:hypothetical protein